MQVRFSLLNRIIFILFLPIFSQVAVINKKQRGENVSAVTGPNIYYKNFTVFFKDAKITITCASIFLK